MGGRAPADRRKTPFCAEIASQRPRGIPIGGAQGLLINIQITLEEEEEVGGMGGTAGRTPEPRNGLRRASVYGGRLQLRDSIAGSNCTYVYQVLTGSRA